MAQSAGRYVGPRMLCGSARDFFCYIALRCNNFIPQI